MEKQNSRNYYRDVTFIYCFCLFFLFLFISMRSRWKSHCNKCDNFTKASVVKHCYLLFFFFYFSLSISHSLQWCIHVWIIAVAIFSSIIFSVFFFLIIIPRPYGNTLNLRYVSIVSPLAWILTKLSLFK